MPTKKTTNKLSQLYKTIDQKELSADAKKALADLRLATGNFRKQEGKEADAFMLFYNRLVNKKPTAVKTTKEYKAMLTERRRENGRKAMEARKAKQESRQGQGSEKDAARPAKPFGWRLKGKHNYRKPTRADIRTGKAYYEARINRADTKRTKFPMLERGGYMEHGGKTHDFKLNFVPQTTLGGKSIATRKDIEMFEKNTVNNPVLGEYVEKFYYDFQNEMGYLILNDSSKEGIFIAVLDSFNLQVSPYQKYAKGGAIKNQYEGREAEDIWNNLTFGQRLHFLKDHESDLKLKVDGMPLKDYFEETRVVARLKFAELKKKIQDEFEVHTIMGQYADGGYMEHGGDVDKDGMIYALRELVPSMVISKKTNVDYWSGIEFIRQRAIKYYINNGDVPYSVEELDRVLTMIGWEYGTFEGYMEHGGEVDKGGMIYALRNEISGGTIANKSGVDSYDDIAKVRRMAIQYYLDNGDVNYSLGELDRVLAMVGAEMGTKMAKGGVFYTDSHKQGH